MTTLRIGKTTFRKRSVYVLEYAICMTTLRKEKTTFRKRSLYVLEDAESKDDINM